MPAILQNVEVTEDALIVDLADGRTTSTPLAWYPRLHHAKPEERGNWRLIGEGEGVHWPDLDEDVSAENILFGRPSQESQEYSGAGWPLVQVSSWAVWSQAGARPT